jgi:virginiamycin B lyase
VTEYHLPATALTPYGLTTGPDHALWFTDYVGNAIWRFDPHNGATARIGLAQPKSNPAAIRTGPDGAMWFTEFGLDKLARLDPLTHAVTELPTPTKVSSPEGLAVGHDHALWFTEFTGNRIGRFDPTAPPPQARIEQRPGSTPWTDWLPPPLG